MRISFRLVFSLLFLAALSGKASNFNYLHTGSILVSGTDTLELYDTYGNKINNGKITVTGTNPSVETLTGYIRVKNTTTVNMPGVYVRRTVNNEISGSLNWFCFGPSCYGPAVNVSPNPTSIAAGATDNSFYGDYYPGGKTGITSVTYEFFDNTTFSKPVRAKATIDFHISLVGIDNNKIVFSGPYPNPSSRLASFDFTMPEGNNSARIIIRNTHGVVVETCSIENRTGKKSIDVSKYPPGIYFYSFMVDGEVVQSKKMIVKH